MTTPKVNTIKRSGSRFYVEPDSGEKVPGVTSVIGTLDKSFLKYWAAKLVAEEAVDSLGALVAVRLDNPENGREAAIDMLKRAPDRNTRKAADIGTAAHDIFERMSKGETVGRVHPDLVAYRDHFDDYLQVVQPEYLHMEETVWSDTHKYAGSFDACAKIDGEVVWLDNKTTRSGVHAEVALQLAAYRYADHIIRPDGGRAPMPKASGAAVLHVRPEGWKLVPVKADEEVFEFFVAIRKAFDWRDLSKSVVGQSAYEGGASEDTGPKRRTPRARKAA